MFQIDKKRENVENTLMKTIKPYLHKINYYETDKMAITHHSNYIRFMEEARVDFLDQLGWSFIKLEEEGMASPVMSVEGVYKKSTTFPDTIEIMVGIEKLSAAKLTFSYEFKCKGEVVFLGKSTHCFLDTRGVPVLIEKRYPDFFADLKAIYEAGKKE
jgi:acyl-CoA thioester hydrolase